MPGRTALFGAAGDLGLGEDGEGHPSLERSRRGDNGAGFGQRGMRELRFADPPEVGPAGEETPRASRKPATLKRGARAHRPRRRGRLHCGAERPRREGIGARWVVLPELVDTAEALRSHRRSVRRRSAPKARRLLRDVRDGEWKTLRAVRARYRSRGPKEAASIDGSRPEVAASDVVTSRGPGRPGGHRSAGGPGSRECRTSAVRAGFR